MNHYQCKIRVFFVLILLVIVGCDNRLTNDDEEEGIISGFVQKGPFIKGLSLTIQVLDESLNPTGKTYHTQILNNSGEFSISINTMDSFFEFIAQGFYFNEMTNSLSPNNLTLRAIAKIDEESTININTLTYIIIERVRYLVNQKGLTFNEAKKQAENELLTNFHIPIDIISGFEELDISQSDESSAVLLAISSILLANRTTAEFTELLANIASDMREDGTIDDPKLLTEINQGNKNINYFQIKNNLRERYKSLGLNVSIPKFEKYCDRDGDGILNFENSDLTMITRIDSNGCILMIDETDWNYQGEYQVGDTITLSSSTDIPAEYKLFPPFPNPITLNDTLNFHWYLPAQTRVLFYLFNDQGDGYQLGNNELLSPGSYSISLATSQFQLGYYEVIFVCNNELVINGTILIEE